MCGVWMKTLGCLRGGSSRRRRLTSMAVSFNERAVVLRGPEESGDPAGEGDGFDEFAVVDFHDVQSGHLRVPQT